MAKLTAYQKQFGRRMKRAVALRARADRRARLYAGKLAAALAEGELARNVVNRLNQLYGVDVSTETLLVHELRTQDYRTGLAAALGGSAPGEEVVLYNPVADSNGGAELPPEVLLDPDFRPAVVVAQAAAVAAPPTPAPVLPETVQEQVPGPTLAEG